MTNKNKPPISVRYAIQQLSCGALRPQDAGPGLSWRLIRHAREHVKSRQQKIANYISAGRINAAKKEQRRAINDIAFRMLAASRAVKVPRKELHTRFAQLWAVTTRIGLAHRPDSVMVYSKRKADNDFRLVCQFSLQDKAQQHLLRLVLTPFLSFHPAQFGLRGRSVAVETLMQAMNETIEDAALTHIDVRGFFDCINHQWLEENLPLPRRLIRSSAHTGGMHLLKSRRRQARLFNEDIERMARSGIPQGSALSALVSEWLMAEILRAGADPDRFTPVVNYSDNLAAIVDRTDAERLAEHWRMVFRNHRAGPFEIRLTVTPLNGPFRFLGYNFVRDSAGHSRALVSEEVLQDRLQKFRNSISECHDLDGLRKLRRKMLSYCSAFSACEGAMKLRADAERYCEEEMRSRPSPTVSLVSAQQ